ncbi:MAG: hypothetical protein NTY38_25180 [Acidobacteria bacterium]|nr:hypothetical protein [Acidobacteriota bacterium]
MLGLEFDGLVEVAAGFREHTAVLVAEGAVVQCRRGIWKFQVECSCIIGNYFGPALLFQANQGALEVRMRIGGGEFDGFGDVPFRAGQVFEAAPDGAAANEVIGRLWTEFDGAIGITERPGEVA